MEIKKSLAMLAGAGALLAFTPVVSHAQDAAAGGAASGPFADVPADHWAYQAVNTLQKAGIVIGYPDGTYGGRRPMTRYEFATAIARLLPMINQPNNYATTDQLNALRTDLENQLAQNQAALDALTRLVNEFQPELQQLGQDVTAIQARLANLEGRVAALEYEQQRFHVTGDITMIAQGDASSHKVNGGVYVPFIDKNGVAQPFTNVHGTSITNNILDNDDVYEDVLLHLAGRVSNTATAHVDLDFENYENNLGNTARAGDPTGVGFAAGQDEPVGGLTGTYGAYVYKAYLDTPIALGPLAGASVEIGRVGTQFTKWTLMQQDADIYTDLIQTDSGDVIGDGGKLAFKVGPVGVAAFAVKNNTTPYSQLYVGTAINPAATNVTSGAVTANPATGAGATSPVYTLTAATVQRGAHPAGTFESDGLSINNAAPVNQSAGARLTVGDPSSLVLGATVEQFSVGNNLSTLNGGNVFAQGFTDPNKTTANVWNRLSVYGLDLNGGLPFGLPFGIKKGAITVDAAYNVSAEGENGGFNNVGNTYRYSQQEYQAGFNLGPIAFKGGYQYIGPYYSAPGYWGKIGDWTNPTNVEGAVYSLKIPLIKRLAVDADYEQYKAAYGNNQDGSLVESPLQRNDHINRYQAGLTYGLSSRNAVDLGYENVQYDLRNQSHTLNAAGHPTEDYITIGLGHQFNENASFKLLYQIIHYNDRGTGFGTNLGGGNGNYSGDVAVGQFSLKF